MRLMIEGPTNEGVKGRLVRKALSLSLYKKFFQLLDKKIQDEVTARWGAPVDDAYVVDNGLALPVLMLGETVVGLQPERAFGMDAKQVYHAPDIVPTHHYLAFYFWLRFVYKADAIIHMGKHGNLEWLPGKALALSNHCYPEIALGSMPHIYPFIVNDPGEGTQAKRRSSAVIIDHLTPPLTRAESYGPLKDLEGLVDEYKSTTRPTLSPPIITLHSISGSVLFIKPMRLFIWVNTAILNGFREKLWRFRTIAIPK